MKKRLVCKECGSTDILVDAYAEWNEKTQKFKLFQTFPEYICGDCEGGCCIEWKEIEP